MLIYNQKNIEPTSKISRHKTNMHFLHDAILHLQPNKRRDYQIHDGTNKSQLSYGQCLSTQK